MTEEPPQPKQQHQEQPGPSLPSALAAPLLTSFTTFLTLSIHTLLYHRGLYPSRTFITARAYNLPVQQSRHPGVCAWVNDAVSAAAGQLASASVEKVVFVVHAPPQQGLRVLERWVFDVGLFPEWGSGVGEGPGADIADAARGSSGEEVNWTDVNEALRGALRRLAYAAEKMEKPPEGSTFTLAVELRDEAPAPIAHPQHWIPSQPESRPAMGKRPEKKAPEKTTTPIRTVRAGPLFFECWIEQPKAQADEPDESGTTDEPSSHELGIDKNISAGSGNSQSKDGDRTNTSS